MGLNKKPKVLDEVFNSVSHGIGILLAIIGLIIFFLNPSNANNVLKIISFSIFAACLINLYLMSTLSHSLIFTKAKKVFTAFDHSSIFFLIAGTYTPFSLIILKGALGWILLSIVWLFSILGVIFKTFFLERFKLLTVFFYLILGWVGLIAIKPLFISLKPGMFFLLVLGGLLYSLGTIFYISKKIPFSHAIWHLFVLGGSICHFLSAYSIYS